jgi:hypothetical protein
MGLIAPYCVFSMSALFRNRMFLCSVVRAVHDVIPTRFATLLDCARMSDAKATESKKEPTEAAPAEPANKKRKAPVTAKPTVPPPPTEVWIGFRKLFADLASAPDLWAENAACKLFGSETKANEWAAEEYKQWLIAKFRCLSVDEAGKVLTGLPEWSITIEHDGVSLCVGAATLEDLKREAKRLFPAKHSRILLSIAVYRAPVCY